MKGKKLLASIGSVWLNLTFPTPNPKANRTNKLTGSAKLEVFSPAGATEVPSLATSRLANLSGKTICELSNWAPFREVETFPILEELLREKYTGIKLISYNEFPSTLYPGVHGSIPKDLTADMLSEKGCEAVISGNGG